MRTLYMIGNTRFDPAWLWGWDEAIARIRAAFRDAYERMRAEYRQRILPGNTLRLFPKLDVWLERKSKNK